ncbi:MAG: hypothetical protein MR717_07620 [Prevotella sp.]|nr:hypothetical protein [Prevotella sp.]
MIFRPLEYLIDTSGKLYYRPQLFCRHPIGQRTIFSIRPIKIVIIDLFDSGTNIRTCIQAYDLLR